MKRWLLATLVLGCAPAAAEVDSSCDSVADCPLDEVCDPMGRCIPEPADRFLGTFTCQALLEGDSATVFELSEVIGHIEGDRWALPAVVDCSIDPDDDRFSLLFASFTSGAALMIALTASELSDRVGSLGLYFDGYDAAQLVDFDAHEVFGYSEEGRVELSETPTPGNLLEGYVDVSMYATDHTVGSEEALFGVPCPRGMADCGRAWGDVGGADLCAEFLYAPMCTRACNVNSDCALGEGVCVHLSDEVDTTGFCTLPCVSDGNCQSPLVCFPGRPGEGNGCF